MAHKEIDQLSGVETTGHTWDGLKELNHPLPRWWLWTFYASIIWSLGYYLVYPSWPLITGYTTGFLGYSQRAAALAERKVSRKVCPGKGVYCTAHRRSSGILNTPVIVGAVIPFLCSAATLSAKRCAGGDHSAELSRRLRRNSLRKSPSARRTTLRP